MKKIIFTLAIAFWAILSIAQTTVVDIVVNSEDHTTLETAVIAAELADVLSGDGPFTVFAPTDAAFDALPDGTLETLLMDPTRDLADILLYHVVGAKVLSSDLSDGQTAATLNGKDIDIMINDDGVFINGAQVTVADIEADNGVVHVIDAVLIPPTTTVVDIVVNSEDHTTLEAAVIAAELADDLSGDGPFTVFAPTDAAFDALPDGTVETLLMDPTGDLADILLYHVVGAKVLSSDLSDGQTATTLNGKDIDITINDDGVFINGAQVTVADIEADNGVVHVIDAVLLPPTTTVVDIIVNSPDHQLLENAVIAAELVDDLSGEGPFTVFAPTDAAFTALPSGTFDLAPILLYHVIGAKVLSTDLSDGQMAMTLNGKEITVKIEGDNIFINDAQVTVADIEADNGVVHVIDAVLLPPKNVVDIIVESEVHTTLEAAVIAAELADDLSGDGPFTVFAPTDAAFDALPDGLLDNLLEDPTGDLASILLYHALGTKVLSSDLSDGQMATTILGENIDVTINDDGVFINDAQVTIADIEAVNGVVHVIDAVLLPPAPTVVDIISLSAVHNTLEAAIIAAELDDDLMGAGPFTVFAPTDDAFDALPDGTVETLLMDPTGDLASILLYHVLGTEVASSDLSDGQTATTLNGKDIDITINDDGVFINGAQVTIVDIEANNGIVHVIDAVLLPPTTNVVDIIVNSEDHTTLEAAVIAAELADDLIGDGPFTVFAPTDAAFDALPDGTVETLLMDPTGDLADILLYHVIGGKVLSSDLSDGQTAATLLGENINVTINDDGVFINGAQVTVADIEADNGVVHVINAVLLPPSITSTSQLEEIALNVFPNPASKTISVELPEDILSEISTGDILDATGKIVQTIQLNNTINKVDISNLNTGMYFLSIKTDSVFAIRKISIQ